MALDQSALLEVLDALKVADVGDRVRSAAETIYQALIEAELTDAIGAAPHERSAERTAQPKSRSSTTNRDPGHEPGHPLRIQLVQMPAQPVLHAGPLPDQVFATAPRSPRLADPYPRGGHRPGRGGNLSTNL